MMNREITVQIMGAGAIGSLFGGLIRLAGFKVHFVARGKQLEALKKDGLILTGLLEGHLKVDASNNPENADITIVAVKAYDTENAARILSKIDPGIVFTIQNGIGNVEILSKYLDRVVGGVTTYGANLVAPGVVNFAGKGIVYAGDDGYISDDAKVVAEVLRRAGFNCEVVDDISFRIWSKAIVNAAINPLTAICRVRNGKIVEVEELWGVAKAIVEEGVRVLKKMGLPEADFVGMVREVALKTSENRSSMLQDIENGKRTEIEFINGAIVRRAKEFGLEAPTNELLVNLVKGVEKAYGIG
ncbi:MAG: 2-dehydropantoate 2-reductase [Archaeoglobus sp.]|nr:2-dehydropantoate 2-reductase [Archaeoglobus sp.]